MASFQSMIEAEVLGTYDKEMGVGDKAVMVELGDMKGELLLVKKT